MGPPNFLAGKKEKGVWEMQAEKAKQG